MIVMVGWVSDLSKALARLNELTDGDLPRRRELQRKIATMDLKGEPSWRYAPIEVRCFFEHEVTRATRCALEWAYLLGEPVHVVRAGTLVAIASPKKGPPLAH